LSKSPYSSGPSKERAHIQKATGDKCGRGKFPWDSLPDCVKESKIAPNYHDYHGNFTAELFEQIFDRLCKKLEQNYGSCHIHLDGAKYHMRRQNAKPSISTKISEILEWYERNGFALRSGSGNKDALLNHLKTIEHEATMPTYETAKKYSHEIIKTQPYHCELQSIEKVWGIVKNVAPPSFKFYPIIFHIITSLFLHLNINIFFLPFFTSVNSL
jgi:hypothetical protein